jgi:Zn-dependent protease with chaperone function
MEVFDNSPMDFDPANDPVFPAPRAVYFDGTSSRRRAVTLAFADRLEIRQDEQPLAAWPYDDIRRADAPSGMLRSSCLSAPSLARLEIRDGAVAARLIEHCARFDDAAPGRGAAAIVGWSLAAVASIVLVILFGVPLAADRLAPLLPQSFERRLGDATDSQVKVVFGAKVCDQPAGQSAFTKLMDQVREAAGLDAAEVEPKVLPTGVPNAFALPGGRVYLFEGLLAKADSADEIAGVLAHELGHVKHRDGTRNLIYNGGTSFLVGLLFGDVTGSGALIFASRSLITASYSREAEYNADSVSIEAMHRLGRPTRPMGELLFRVTGNEGDKGLSILGNHPLTEDRLARMKAEDHGASRPPPLTPDEWRSLKAICGSKS